MMIGILVLNYARTKLPNGDTILLYYDGNKGNIGIVLVVCFASLPIIIWLCWRLIKNDTDSIELEVPEGGIRCSASSVNHQTADQHHENIHGPSVNINMTSNQVVRTQNHVNNQIPQLPLVLHSGICSEN